MPDPVAGSPVSSAPHVSVRRSVRISNVWLLQDADGRRFLVDTGHPAERAQLFASLWRAGVRYKGDLTAILLTHRHSDHAGNAAALRARFGCPVVAHQDDAKILAGATPRPAMARRGARLHHELLCRVEDRLPARLVVDESVPAGLWRHGFSAVHVGGHTEGSVLWMHPPTKTLFSGDLVLSGAPVQRSFVRLQLAVKEYSLDVAAAHRGVRAFLATEPQVDWLCSGHGPLVQGPRFGSLAP
jgi:glyoxylase-like metal-dependent hydrolase (beta-lactamase superfamily II)